MKGVEHHHYLRIDSDYFVGRRGRLDRYLVCSLGGYFPVLVKTGPDSLAVILRTDGPHIGIMATLSVSTSTDGGKSWSDLMQLAPRFEDIRNPAFGVNAEGQLVAAYWQARLNRYIPDPNGRGLVFSFDESDSLRNDIPALFTVISGDGGRTWSEPVACKSEVLTTVSPYGRIIAGPSGSLLMSAYGVLREPKGGVNHAVILVRSMDGGRTWGDESLVAIDYNETSFALLPNGRLIAAMRKDGRDAHIATSFSSDGGRTWTEPVKVTRGGEHPADLTLLSNGKLLLTFGRRVRPFGCGALVSDDLGATWNVDREIMLAGDGIRDQDVGYPSTVQLDCGAIVTVLYYGTGSEASDQRQLRGWGDVSCQAIHYREENLV
ncbi:MAG: exo-alpha-sialidase [Paenibacillaceae bacterium]|nr:exo-alpha-sialidase [Paenibacillaceae bacterium]